MAFIPRSITCFALACAATLAQAQSPAPNSPSRGDFGPFMRSLSNTSWGYSVVPDPTGAAPTATVERFEVRPGDAAANSSWDDRTSDRERSELSEVHKNTQAGSDAWYGWYMYLPADYPNIYPAKVDLVQFHQKDSRPIWMFQNDKGGYWLDNHIAGGASKDYVQLIDEAQLRGRWHHVEVFVHWSRQDDGVFQVWVNGESKYQYSGPTMTAQAAYFKYGIYRSFVSRYKQAKGVDAVPAQVVYYTGVRKGKTR